MGWFPLLTQPVHNTSVHHEQLNRLPSQHTMYRYMHTKYMCVLSQLETWPFIVGTRNSIHIQTGCDALELSSLES